ncbi:hypothetical protein HRbin19_01651 [bacterium HR19]|nr:hypothetical protein HRbin19_01651 [bacterium HR19]
MDGKVSDFIFRFQEIKKSVLKPEDVEMKNGREHIRFSGWLKLKTSLSLSSEIKLSERLETEKEGKKVVIWRYIIRVSSKDGVFSEAEGVAGTDEFDGKSENFISYTAYTRALGRAVSFFFGLEDGIKEDADAISYTSAKKPERKEISDFPQDEIIEKWQEKERKLEREIRDYSDIILKKEEEKGPHLDEEQVYEEKFQPKQETEIFEGTPQAQRKLTQFERREIFSQIGELLNKLGYKTPEEKRDYVSKILKRAIARSSEMQDEELLFVYDFLKKEVVRKR